MNAYLIFILIVLIATYILDLVMDILNIKNLSPELPSEFKNIFEEEKYRKSQSYLKENTKVSNINKTIFTVLSIAFILTGGFNFIDNTARNFGFGQIGTGLIFTGTLVFVYYILELPFDIYDTFVIEEKYGFNKTTPKTYLLDTLKNIVLAVILGGIILSGIIWFFSKFETWAWLYVWIVSTLFQLIISYLAPVIILPIFNKFIPLEDSELKTAVLNYAKGQNFKLKGIYKMDGSKRSTKSNAYFTGFGRFRRIVLFDTLIEKHTVDELVAVLAHEMGHFKKKHIISNLITSVITTGIMFFLLSLFINNKGLFDAFGMENLSVYASLLFFGFLYSPVLEIISVFSTYISRKHEYEADEYAVKTGNKPESLISALKKLSIDNLSNLNPHPLMVFFKYSHPPVLERIKKLRQA
jgi:STE24 endopeptidase